MFSKSVQRHQRRRRQRPVWPQQMVRSMSTQLLLLLLLLQFQQQQPLTLVVRTRPAASESAHTEQTTPSALSPTTSDAIPYSLSPTTSDAIPYSLAVRAGCRGLKGAVNILSCAEFLCKLEPQCSPL